MTVVTAFAVSWNPLMNSKAKATNRAKNSRRNGPVERAETASQNVIHPPGEPGGGCPRSFDLTGYFAGPARGNSERGEFRDSSQFVARNYRGTRLASLYGVRPTTA